MSFLNTQYKRISVSVASNKEASNVDVPVKNSDTKTPADKRKTITTNFCLLENWDFPPPSSCAIASYYTNFSY